MVADASENYLTTKQSQIKKLTNELNDSKQKYGSGAGDIAIKKSERFTTLKLLTFHGS